MPSRATARRRAHHTTMARSGVPFSVSPQAPLDVQRNCLPPQLRGHGPPVHPRQRRPPPGEGVSVGPRLGGGAAVLGQVSPRRAESAAHLVLPSQVREMVEIITKEFVLMGGTVDVVSAARPGAIAPRPHSAGRAVLCAPSASATARAVPAWGCPRPMLGVSPRGARLPVGWHLTGPARPAARVFFPHC